MSSGGSKPKTVTTTTNNDPWAPTQPGLKQGITDLGQQYASGQFLKANQAYPGQTVADLAPETVQSWNNATAIANGPQTDIKAAQDYNRSLLSGDLTTGYLGQLTNNVANNVNGQFSLAGRYGSGAHQNAISQGITSAVLPYAQQAAQFAPTLAQAEYLPSQMLASVGSARQGYAQDLINAEIQKYNQQQSAPISAITDYMQALSGNWGGGTTATQPYQAGNSTNPWLQGAGVGASLLGSYLSGA